MRLKQYHSATDYSLTLNFRAQLRLSKFKFRAIDVSRRRLRFEPEKALATCNKIGVGVECVDPNLIDYLSGVRENQPLSSTVLVMSQFSLEAEIQSALRLDSSINVQKSSMSRPVGRNGGGSVLNVSGKQFNASGLNRSRSESRLHTALFGGGGVAANNSLRQQSQRRSGSRGRTGSLLDLSSTGGGSAGSSKSPGRMCSDRFIPNRSTTDMEFAQHSLSRYFVIVCSISDVASVNFLL